MFRWARWAILSVAAMGCATTAVDTAAGTWHEVSTQRFRAWTNGDPEDAAALVRELEQFRRVALSVTSAEEREGSLPMQILIARNAVTFRASTKDRAAAGLFKSTRKTHAARPEFTCVAIQPAQADPLPESDVKPISSAEAYHRVGEMVLASFADAGRAGQRAPMLGRGARRRQARSRA